MSQLSRDFSHIMGKPQWTKTENSIEIEKLLHKINSSFFISRCRYIIWIDQVEINQVLKIAINCRCLFLWNMFDILAIPPYLCLNVLNFRKRLLVIDHSARKRQGIFLFFFANIDSRCICYNVTVCSVLAPVIQDWRNWVVPLPILCQHMK